MRSQILDLFDPSFYSPPVSVRNRLREGRKVLSLQERI